MNDPLLDSYWKAVQNERYQAHLRYLPGRLERASRRRASSRVVPRLAWALGAFLVVAVVGFIPVQITETTGFLISGRTESRLTSETLGALKALPLPVNHNLSVSADTHGTTFALFLPDDGSNPVDTWTARVEASIEPTDLRVRTIDVVADRLLWRQLLDRVGVTISAGGSTRAEIQAQVERQLEALGSGRAEVEQVTGPDGQESVQIIISDIE